MSDSLSITVYLCSGEELGIATNSISKGVSVSSTNNTSDINVTAYIVPAGFIPPQDIVTAHIAPVGAFLILCKQKLSLNIWPNSDASTVVYTGTNHQPQNTNWGAVKDVSLGYNIPQNCGWLQTTVQGEHLGFIEIIRPNRTPRSINKPDGTFMSKAEVLGGLWQRATEVQNLVPGEKIIILHEFQFSTFPQVEMWTQYAALTGGWILARYPSTNRYSVANLYDIDVEGKTLQNIVATDFYDYQVGDWVFLGKIQEGVASEVIRTEPKLGEFLTPMSSGASNTAVSATTLTYINRDRTSASRQNFVQDGVLGTITQDMANYAKTLFNLDAPALFNVPTSNAAGVSIDTQVYNKGIITGVVSAQLVYRVNGKSSVQNGIVTPVEVPLDPMVVYDRLASNPGWSALMGNEDLQAIGIGTASKYDAYNCWWIVYIVFTGVVTTPPTAYAILPLTMRGVGP